jgi:hypothetical protein
MSSAPTEPVRRPNGTLPARARLLRLLVIAAIVQIAGRALDFRWHATHNEFEAVSQQFDAHWLLWLGVLATLAVCVLALRRLSDDRLVRAYRITLISGLAYSVVAVWHFVEHANHNDPSVAHVLLGIGQAAMLVGVALVVVWTRRPSTSAPQEVRL